MKAPWSKLPALPAATGMVAGVLLSALDVGTWVIALTAFSLAVALYLLKRHYLAFIFLFIAIASVFAYIHRPSDGVAMLYGVEREYTAKVNDAAHGDYSAIYTVSITKVNTSPWHNTLCRLTVMSGERPIEVGSIIRFEGELQPTSSATDLPYEVDYGKFLSAEGIDSRCTVIPAKVMVVGSPDRVTSVINNIRRSVYNAIVTAPVSGATSAMFLATILGDDSLLREDAYSSYRNTGTAHILALSGLHVGILVGLMFFMFLPLHVFKRGSLWRSVITIILVWGYVIIVGFTPSILRAGVMVTVFLCARQIQQGYNSVNALLLSVVVILCINPWWLFTPGFQMSVAAVASLICLAGLFPKKLQRHRVMFWFVTMISVPVAAMIGTGIISAYYFNTFPLLFLVANVVVGFLFPAFLTIGFILVMLGMMGLSLPFVGFLADLLYNVINTSIMWIASKEWACVGDLYFSAWSFLPYYIMVAFAVFAVKYRSRTYGIMSMCFFIVFIIVLRTFREQIPSAEVYVPRHLSYSYIIMRSGDDAWLYTDAIDPETEKQNCEGRYAGFLGSRGCNDFSLIDQSSVVKNWPYYVKLPYIRVLDRMIYIADSDSLLVNTADTHIDYAIICQGFTGNTFDLLQIIKPDTVWLSAGLHPSRRKRFISELTDSVPWVDLRHAGIKWNFP